MAKVEGVFANLNPIRIAGATDFGSIFTEKLSEAEQVVMCTGYVAAESLVELLELLKSFSNVRKFDLIVGMAKFDGLTRDQLCGLEKLEEFLTYQDLGRVHIAAAVPVHAKVTSFVGGRQSILLGSSNLGSLTRATRQYEVDLIVQDDPDLCDQVDEFLAKAISASKFFSEIKDELTVVSTSPHPLENLAGVSKISIVTSHLEFESDLEFEIPIGVGEKSNLNTFFGKGRKSINNRVVPRPWYEVELIVPKRITEISGYPVKDVNDGEFTVITDDGFEFKCRTSGDYSKNLRSKADLETLGRWLKGRLERSGALEMGEMVTNATLEKYGRKSIGLKKLQGEDKWFMDFGVQVD